MKSNYCKRWQTVILVLKNNVIFPLIYFEKQLKLWTKSKCKQAMKPHSAHLDHDEYLKHHCTC